MATTLLTAPVDLADPPPRSRWAFWRSPEGQPAYARPALLAITALAAVLYAWNINRSGYHGFYADAARSMSESWKSFLYGSFDPGNTITLDKLPGFLWPQAISARLFGFHPWSLTLPQVAEGVLAVLVMFRTVRRWAGANAALLAAAAFTLTPVLAGLFRTAVEDPLFTLLLLLAADATMRATRDARLRSLILAGVWVGLAFQAKMLEAWAVLPALAAVYLLAAPTALRRRFGHVALAGLVTVAVSASWMVLVTLTPAQDRPYVDGTTDNSAYSMVVGYNFLNRFSSVGLNADDTGSIQGTRGGSGFGGGAGGAEQQRHQRGEFTGQQGRGQQGQGQAQAGGQGQGTRPQAWGGGSGDAGGSRGPGGAGGPGGSGGRNSDGGWTKMFGSQFGSQTGWLYPLAALAVICGVAWRRGRSRTDTLRAGFVLWGTWLAVFFLVFSAGSVGGHSYYMGVIGAPLAALAGAGTLQLWHGFRAGGRRAWALPAAIAATVAWCAVLAWRFPHFLPWLAPVTILLGVVALALLGLARLATTTGQGPTTGEGTANAEAATTGWGSPAGQGSTAGNGAAGLGLTAGQGAATTGGGAAAVGRLASRLGLLGRIGGRRFALAGLLAGIAAMLVAPGAWAASVLDPKYGNSGMGTVGPATSGFGGGASGSGKAARSQLESEYARLIAAYGGGMPGGRGGGFGGDSATKLTASQQHLLDYAEAHRNGAQYVFATTSWSAASPYILATGAPVMPMGGFTGAVPSPTLPEFQHLVATGKVRLVLLNSGRQPGGAEDSGTVAGKVSGWVQGACTPVPTADTGTLSDGQLYECTSATG